MYIFWIHVTQIIIASKDVSLAKNHSLLSGCEKHQKRTFFTTSEHKYSMYRPHFMHILQEIKKKHNTDNSTDLRVFLHNF